MTKPVTDEVVYAALTAWHGNPPLVDHDNERMRAAITAALEVSGLVGEAERLRGAAQRLEIASRGKGYVDLGEFDLALLALIEAVREKTP
jgi:hypothetical protein